MREPTAAGPAVRRARPGDLRAVHELDETLFPRNSCPYFVFRQALDALPGFFLLGESNGRVAGYSLGSMQAGDEHGWVLSLGVAPEHRGRRLGRALTAELLRAFSERGARAAFLHVSPDNPGAIGLYGRLGFEEVRREPDCFGPGEDRLIMRCSLLPR
ncbi:MAG TPA: N-acetyltransferase [Chloroflexota bacterium]|nr:N-acetyltransferase [Chloroflexota bacterium]